MGADFTTFIVLGKDISDIYDVLNVLLLNKYDQLLDQFLDSIYDEVNSNPEQSRMEPVRLFTDSAYGDDTVQIIGLDLFEADSAFPWVVDLKKISRNIPTTQWKIGLYWDCMHKLYPDVYDLIASIPESCFIVSRVE